MIQESTVVVGVRKAAENTYVVQLRSPQIAKTVRAGQFVNIRVEESTEPLLRRPFSVYRVESDVLEVIFNVIGRGTQALVRKQSGDAVDVIGPLGVPFSLAHDDYQTAILVGGGLGVAPLPISTDTLRSMGRDYITILGARQGSYLAEQHLENLHVATDDGSRGYHGTVVELLEDILASRDVAAPKIFACGPTAMLKALSACARSRSIPCEISMEGPMACGIGICQGCPVELVDGHQKYALMCKDGPTFDINRVRI